ncbi:MAG: tetratricopeptide repeat protein [Bacteroidia bacterium]|nr:tetratricopeptide repeat protein [Bacteroidia bacterium]MDW8157827.1 tetratricopeptide repeat protein [Bacteroidia bacterium]
MAKAKIARYTTNSNTTASNKALPLGSLLNSNWDKRLFQWGTILVVLAAFLLYIQTVSYDYALDDGVVIGENIHTQKGIKGIGALLTKDSFHGYYSYYTQQHNVQYEYLPGGRYRPLSIITFAIEHSLWGDIPQISHFINVLLYCTTAFVLWYWLYRYVTSFWPALIATLIFIVHPTHVEAVANIKGRDEILSFLLITLTLIFALKKQEQPLRSTLWLFLSLISFSLALLAKENGLMLLGILPLTLYCLSQTPQKKLLSATLPYAIVVGFYIFVRVGVTGFSLKNSTDVMNNAFLYASFTERYATIVYILSQYLKLFLFPFPLSWDYGYNQIGYHTFLESQVIAALLINGGFLLLGIKNLNRQNIIGYSILYYFFSIFIVSGLAVNIGGAFMAERFLYHASLGSSLLLATALVNFAQKLFSKSEKYFRFVVISICAVFCIPLATQTIKRNPVWKNNTSLFLADIDAAPKSARILYAAGETLVNLAIKRGEDKPQIDTLQLAKPLFERAIQVHPTYADAYLWLGRIYWLQKDTTTATHYWAKAYQYEPLKPLAKQVAEQMTFIYTQKGQKALQQQNPVQAQAAFENVLLFSPQNHFALFNLGMIHGAIYKQYDKSISYLQKAIQNNPTLPDYWYNLGVMYKEAGKKIEAQNAWKKTLELNPKHAAAKAALEIL